MSADMGLVRLEGMLLIPLDINKVLDVETTDSIGNASVNA